MKDAGTDALFTKAPSYAEVLHVESTIKWAGCLRLIITGPAVCRTVAPCIVVPIELFLRFVLLAPLYRYPFEPSLRMCLVSSCL